MYKFLAALNLAGSYIVSITGNTQDAVFAAVVAVWWLVFDISSKK